MFDGIQTIEWSKLDHAYCCAEDVPKYIDMLIDRDIDIANNGLDSLMWSIYHQGTVYSATPYAVPFLVEALVAANPSIQKGILSALASIATGASYHEAHSGLESFQEASNEGDGFKLHEQITIEREYVKKSTQAVLNYWYQYIPFLESPNSTIRIQAVILVATLARFDEIQADDKGWLPAFAMSRPENMSKGEAKLFVLSHISEKLKQEAEPEVIANLYMALILMEAFDHPALSANHLSSASPVEQFPILQAHIFHRTLYSPDYEDLIAPLIAMTKRFEEVEAIQNDSRETHDKDLWQQWLEKYKA